jgi:FAD dependent oxidoreductase
MNTNTIFEQARRTPVLGEYDVVVLGGGPAGIAAAVAAARAGSTTLLVERYGFLGGMGTAAGVTNFCGLHANVHGEIRQVVHGVADDLLSRMDRLGGLNEPHGIFNGKIHAQAYDTATYKIAADDLLVSSGAELLFHAYAAGVVMRSEAEIEAVLIETKSGRRAVIGRIYIDSSGDGDLAAWAGAPFEKGDSNGALLYPSTMFRLNGVDPRRAEEVMLSIPDLMEDEEAQQAFNFTRKGAIVRPQKHPEEWRANVTQLQNPDGTAVDGTDVRQMTYGEIQGRRQVADYFRFLQTRVPGFEKSYIVDTAPQLGIRETRRFMGGHVLSGDDVINCVDFEDTIGVNGWPLEMHVAGDVRWIWPDIPTARGFNHLPYRMIVPQRVDNLFVAGRCASMSHEGHSAARVTGACFVMGQAAGTAAHQAIQAGVRPRDIDVADLQRRLGKDGAYLGTKW